MELQNTRLRGLYYHSGRSVVVNLITGDPFDASSLLVEPRDEIGDIEGGDLFRCEARELTPLTPEIWEELYPASDPDNLRYADVCKPEWPEWPGVKALELRTIPVVSTAHITREDDELLSRPGTLGHIDGALRFGYMLRVSVDRDDWHSSMSDSFMGLMKFVRNGFGFKWVILDRDGPVIPSLPTHEW